MTKRVRAVSLVGMLGALLLTVGAGSASANWGLTGRCGIKSGPVNERCYAIAEDDISTYATVGLEETRYSTVPHCAPSEGYAFVTQEMWAFSKAEIGGALHSHWVEDGQIVGRGYCDQEPHIFSAEMPPDTNNPELFHFEESGLPSPEHQLNMYAISDPERNGRWFTYYRIPNESGVWTAFGGGYGGGWSTTMLEQN